MIPSFETEPGEEGWLQLPPGIHEATWQEVVQRYGTSERRNEILAGLLRALRALKAAGCRRVYIDGSFVTSKEVPEDFDGCWDVEGVDFDQLDPVLLVFDDKRAAQKAKFEGEFFVSSSVADSIGTLFIDFFQHDRNGRPKGIILINLEALP